MPIDVSVPRSPGWWLRRLFNQLGNPIRLRRLQLLHDYRSGNAPLPQGAENAREAFAHFQRKARSNFSELVVSAVSERMTPVGFRTALDADETGDAEVGALWGRAGLDVESNTVHDLMLGLSEAFVVVGPVDDDTGAPVVTAEDPRWMVSESDPANPRKLMAALKVLHDDTAGQDRAYLYLPGRATISGNAEVWVATHKSMTSEQLPTPYPRGPVVNFSSNAWEWDPERSGELDHPRIPVVRFSNKDGVGEYEAHLDLLDRINHQILQRMVIATMQAFRQRAVRGLPLIDERGKEIDYSEVFTMDPAALWQLPKDAEMWESAYTDLRPILDAVKDDVLHLAAVTRTPTAMLMPEGANQSAEGASFAREGLVFKVKDRITRTSHPWAQVISLALLQAGQSERADLSKLQTIWAPPEHLSLAEKADADVKTSNTIPRRSRLIHIWHFSPAEADRIMTEVADEQLLAAQVAAATAAATPPPPPPAAGTPGPAGTAAAPAVNPPAAPPTGAPPPGAAS